MRRIYIYENCKVIVNMPDDDQFQERLLTATEKFMRKVISGRMNTNGNSITRGTINKK